MIKKYFVKQKEVHELPRRRDSSDGTKKYLAEKYLNSGHRMFRFRPQRPPPASKKESAARLFPLKAMAVRVIACAFVLTCFVEKGKRRKKERD